MALMLSSLEGSRTKNIRERRKKKHKGSRQAAGRWVAVEDGKG